MILRQPLWRVSHYRCNSCSFRSGGDWKAEKKKGFLLKLDLQKAYNEVDWEYLDAVLERKGFGKRWRMWMQGCLSMVNFSIIINGRPRGKIFAEKGLRQGDPISPFLFTLVGDSLNRAIHFCCEKRFLKIAVVGKRGTVITHLQYAVDTLIFCQDEEENLDRWWAFLNLFMLGVGLSLNLEKTSLIGIHVDKNRLLRKASQFGCEADSLPIMYLGVPLGGKYKRVLFLGVYGGQV